MKKLILMIKKLNTKGFSHHLVLPVIVAVVIGGVGYLIVNGGHADALTRIAYCSAPDGSVGTIYSSLPNGESKTVLVRNINCATIAWASGANELLYLNNGGISTVSANGGSPQVIYSTHNSKKDISYISYNPLTQRIAAVQFTLVSTSVNGSIFSNQLLTMNLKGQNVKMLANVAGPTGYGSGYIQTPSWSPNGKYLLYETYISALKAGGTYKSQMVAQNVNTGVKTIPSSYTGNKLLGFQLSSTQDWSSNSNTAVGVDLTYQTGTPYIVEWNMPTGNFFTEGDANAFNPVWSPNGSKIAFIQFSSNTSGSHLYVKEMASNGSNVTTVAHWSATPDVPSLQWSGDNSKLAVFNYGRLYVMNANGSDLTLIAGTASRPVVSYVWMN